MKKHLILMLAVAMILGAALAVLAQQADERRARFQRYREAQQQAIDAIQAHAAKLKASMEESARAMRDRPQGQDMSEEQKNQLREAFKKRREEQQKIVADLELQVAKLKGPRQLRTEHEEVVGELRAILDVAGQEKAEKTAGLLEKLIGKQQTKYEETLKKLGFELEQ